MEKVIEQLPDDCPSQVKELINGCRSFEPFQRPSAGGMGAYNTYILIFVISVLYQQASTEWCIKA